MKKIPFSFKAAISDFIALCQHTNQLASLQISGSRSGEEVIHDVEDNKVLETKLKLTDLFCHGCKTIWCFRGAKGTSDEIDMNCYGRE
jgi:hypothetical protein